MISIHLTIKQLFVALFLFALVTAGIWAAGNAYAQGPTGGRRAPATAVGAGFTYQGQLKQNGSPVTATCDARFGLWDASTLGTQVGTTQTMSITVASGLFTATLDFGGTAFNGDARYLQIAVGCPSGAGYTALSPREPITPAPYALTAMKTAYKNVLVVAKQGGHYNTIGTALASITDNSATNRYLIWVAPGTYTETVTMMQYVDIEGAGEIATKITWVGNIDPTVGTVIGANNAELRFLTVENTGGAAYAVAISNISVSPRLTHATATASGGTNNYAVYNGSSSPTMTNVTATASGGTNNYGVLNSSSSPSMTNVNATASGGVLSYGVFNSGGSPMMTNVTATASGGTTNYGVRNDSSSSPTMTNVTAKASGGTSDYAVYNFTSSPSMKNVTATASGGAVSYGVYNYSSSPTIHTSRLSGTGGSTNYGIYNLAVSGAYTVTVNNSQITGNTNTIYNDSEFTTLVGASKLDGGAVNVNGGTIKCAGAFDATYLFSANLCPNFQNGTATLGTSSTGSVTNIYTVTFPSAFSSTPRVIGTLRNDYPSYNVDDTFAVTVRRVFTDTFVVNIKRVDGTGNWSQSLKLDWMAWE